MRKPHRKQLLAWLLTAVLLLTNFPISVLSEVPSSIMRKFVYKSGRTPSAQGRETCA